jgi:hypothetical protein
LLRDNFKAANYAMEANLNLVRKPPAQGTDKYKALALDNITDLWFCAVVLLVLNLPELLIFSCTAVSKAALVFIIHSATIFKFQIQFVYTN